MSYETILYETKGRIAYITLNRPRVLNAYNDTMGDELLQAHRAFDQDDDLHVLIISGAGRAFCSGADVRQRQLRPVDELKRLGGPAGGIRPAGGLLGIGQTVNWKPIIAAVHGYVLGAGFGLAMATDLIVAAAGTKFQIREVQRGIGGAQHWATTWFWGGGRFATEIALTGRYFTAEEAYQFGIVNRVVPQEQVLAEAERSGPGYHAESAVVRAGQCAGVALVRAAHGRGGTLLSGWAEIASDRGFPGVSPGFHGETTARVQGQVELQAQGADDVQHAGPLVMGWADGPARVSPVSHSTPHTGSHPTSARCTRRRAPLLHSPYR